MDAMGNLFNGEWSSFIEVSTDEADFMSQLFSNYSFPSERDEDLSPRATHDQTTKNIGDPINSNLFYFPQVGSHSNGVNFFSPTSGHENYSVTNFNTSNSMDCCMVEDQNTSSSMEAFFPDILMENVGDHLDQKLQLKRKSQTQELNTTMGDETNSLEHFKKKSRVSNNVHRNKKNVPSKEHKIVLISDEKGETNGGLNGQSSVSYISEDDSNTSRELNGGSNDSAAIKSNGRSRTSRGSATNSQSLYARKRRQRINERLRILQTLVPNGTKVDISTMLEEAVEYVKFLQIQIKLLSSDDQWMYAPIAYNGMNIGLI